MRETNQHYQQRAFDVKFSPSKTIDSTQLVGSDQELAKQSNINEFREFKLQ